MSKESESSASGTITKNKGEHPIHFEALFHFDAGEVPEFGPDALTLPINMTYHREVK